jgi:hypothetical protein
MKVLLTANSRLSIATYSCSGITVALGFVLPNGAFLDEAGDNLAA